MKTKLLTLLTLLLFVCSGAWASDVTIGITNTLTTTSKGATTETLSDGGTDLSLSKIWNGVSGSDTYMTEYTTGDKELYYGSSTKQYSQHAYNWKKSSSTYCGVYIGYSVAVPSGKNFSISGINAGLAASAGFTYKVVIENSTGTALYSSEHTITNYNKNTSSGYEFSLSDIDDENIQGLNETFYVKMYVYFSSSGKYICPVALQVTGTLSTTEADSESPVITTNLSEDTYDATIGTPLNLTIAASHAESYQWYSNTSKSTSGSTAIEGATSKTYTYTPTEATTKYFYCVVTNSNATSDKTTTSNIATVTSSLITPEFSLSNSSILVDGTSQIKVGENSGLDGLAMTDLTYDDEIVSISEAGVITGLAKGTSTITFTTAASGNYAAGSAILSITVTGPVSASRTPDSWTGATSMTWSLSRISLAKNEAEGDNGLYFEAGSTKAMSFDGSNSYFSMNEGNIMYLEVPSATSTGTVKVVSTQNDDTRYLNVVNASGTQQLKMSKTGSTVNFDASSISEIDGKYYIKLVRGAGECKIAITNFATITLLSTITPAYEKTTYVTTQPLDFSGVEGLTAYVAESASSTGVKMTSITTVPTGTPLLLVGTASETYTIPAAASATAPETNLLKAGDGTTVFNGSTYDYILYSDGMFYQIGGGTVATNKAYLHLDSAPSGARSLEIIFDDETTGITDNNREDITNNGEYFNLAGQRVAAPVKGLYIVNGRKVVIR